MVVGHLVLPAFHLDNRELALLAPLEHALSIEHESQLAAGETVDIGDLPLANKADDIILGKASLYLESSERVGTVQDDKLFA